MDDGQASKSQTPVIATKLHIPAPGSQRVKRHRLLQALTQALEGKVTLLSAPAGYGKTTLLSEWAADLPVSVGWVSLDRGDQDRIRFWAHTIAALNRACPAFQAQRVWQIAYTDMAGDALIAALINELHRLSAPVVLVWDDFHYITEPRLLREIDYFLERLPEHVHLAIASRTVPQLGLSRMRARGELTELETDALRLTLPETVELLSSYVSVPLSPDEMAAVLSKRKVGRWASVWPPCRTAKMAAWPGEPADGRPLTGASPPSFSKKCFPSCRMRCNNFCCRRLSWTG